jgi:hypothetical protein
MRVKIEINDKEAFTIEDAKKMYSTPFSEAKVEVLPDSDSPKDFIFFGIQNLYTLDQLDIFYEYYPHLYEDNLAILKEKILKDISLIIDQVFRENELKVRE